VRLLAIADGWDGSLSKRSRLGRRWCDGDIQVRGKRLESRRPNLGPLWGILECRLNRRMLVRGRSNTAAASPNWSVVAVARIIRTYNSVILKSRVVR
jgi:hypothetical protein